MTDWQPHWDTPAEHERARRRMSTRYVVGSIAVSIVWVVAEATGVGPAVRAAFESLGSGREALIYFGLTVGVIAFIGWGTSRRRR